jgi:hypothetical protein
MSRMRIELTGVHVRAAEWSETCSTAIDSVSGYVVVVITVLQSRALLVGSSHLANLSGRTAVSHLRTRPGRPGVLAQRMIEAMPGETHARVCSTTPPTSATRWRSSSSTRRSRLRSQTTRLRLLNISTILFSSLMMSFAPPRCI